MTKPGGNHCKLTFRAPEEDKEENQEVIAISAASKEISLCCSDGNFIGTEWQWKMKKVFSQWTTFFPYPPDWLWWEFSCFCHPSTNRKPWTVATWQTSGKKKSDLAAWIWFVQSPSKFYLPFPNAFYVSLTRWICKMNPNLYLVSQLHCYQLPLCNQGNHK